MKKLLILLPLLLLFITTLTFARTDRFDYNIYNKCVQNLQIQINNAEAQASDWLWFSRNWSEYLNSLPDGDEIYEICESEAENWEDRNSWSFYHQLAISAAQRDDYESVIEYLEKAIYYEPVGSEVYNITYNEIQEAKDIIKEEQKQIQQKQDEQDQKAIDKVNEYIKKWNEYRKSDQLDKALAEFQGAKNLMDSYTKISWHTDWMPVEESIELVKKQIKEKETQEKGNTTNTTIQTKPITKDEELKIAIQWMYDNWLTIYNQVQDFLPNNEITREQASKFFVEFAAKVLWKERWNIYNYNIFSDISNADPTLKNHIIYANNMWLFKWTNWKFNPFNKLTKAQAITVTVRMANWYMDENYNPRYLNYYYAADSYWILKWWWYEFDTLDKQNISRWDMALILYNLYLYLNNK